MPLRGKARTKRLVVLHDRLAPAGTDEEVLEITRAFVPDETMHHISNVTTDAHSQVLREGRNGSMYTGNGDSPNSESPGIATACRSRS